MRMFKIFALLAALLGCVPAFALNTGGVNLMTFGAKCDGATDDAAARDKAIAAVATSGYRIYLPEGNCKFSTTTSLTGGIKLVGDGGVSSRTTITYSGTGIAVEFTGSGNSFEGIAVVAASATDGIKLTNSSQNVLRDFKVSGPPTRGLYLSSTSASGTAWNSFQNFQIDTAVTALQMDQSGAGFVNLNTFVTGILRTSTASAGTVATLTTTHGNSFVDIDASNYGTGVVKSWNIAGTSHDNHWVGGLIDTPTGTLTGFTFAAGTSANRVLGMLNLGTTPYSSTGTPITDMTKEAYLDNNGNFFGEIKLATPAFGTAGPAINLYDTGNNGNQFIYGKSGQINIGLDKVTAKVAINPANGSIVAGAVRSTTTAVSLANGLNSDIALTSGASDFLRITGPTGAFSVGGFTNPLDGQQIRVYNSTAQTMTLVNEDAASTAANRLKTLTGGNVVLRAAATSFATFVYNSTDARWILTSTN